MEPDPLDPELLNPSEVEDYDPADVADGHGSESQSEDVGQTFDDGQGRIFPCEGCGADLEFHIGLQSMTCPYCGHVKTIERTAEALVEEQDFHAMLMQLREWREQAARRVEQQADHGTDPSQQRQELRCDSCGGNVEFVGTLTSTHCPYCGSPVQLENAHKAPENRIPVDGMLPFLIEKTTARTNLNRWVNSRWFAPNSFRSQGAEGRFNGVYLSYYTFDSMTFTAYTGERGEYYYVTVGTGKNRRRQRRTRWYSASGQFQRFFDDVLILANTGLRRDFMQELEPWPLQNVVPFNQQLLAGMMARTYDIELEPCFTEARQRIDAAIHSEVCQRIGGDTQRVHSVNSQYDAITFKHLLLPVWLLAYRYSDKTYQVFINAATGEVQGERPYSVWKILFTVLLGIAVVGGIIAIASSR
ncbi:MAG: hypothetical protein KDA85_08205 [Planctomycetaceae bacterium]|nr:hypothetical protein [Planctomycetaceae bacterium]